MLLALLQRIRRRIQRFPEELKERRRIAQLRKRPRAEAAGRIAELKEMKRRHPGRPMLGILLVEHIGDIIACEPVIRWVRQESPDAFIVWVVRACYQELLANHPGLDAIVTVGSLAHVEPIIGSQVFDRFLDLHVDHKPTGVPGLAHIKHWGDPSINGNNYFQQAPLLRAFSKAAGLAPLSAAPKFHIPATCKPRIDALALPDQFVAIHAACNERDREWTAEGWAELVRFLVEDQRLHVIELGLLPKVPVVHPRFCNLCGQLSLLETAEVIRRAGLFLGIDSGLAHMANALERSALILFSRYHGEDNYLPYTGFFAERASEMLYRHPGNLDDLPASRVIERLTLNGALRRLTESQRPTSH